MRRVTPEVRERLAHLAAQGGEPWVDRHVRMVLAMLLVRTLTRAVPYRLPPSVDAELATERLRILDDLESAGSEPYMLSRRLVRNSGMCRGTTLSFGVLSGRLSSSVPQHLLARAGLEHLHESPWIGLHLDIRPAYPHYTAEARARARAHMADFLRINPAYQGTMSVRWMPDRKAVAFSPHRASQVRELLDAGAVSLSLDVTREATVKHDAATSQMRRRADERGEYKPLDYMTLWPRERLIAASEALRREPSDQDP